MRWFGYIEPRGGPIHAADYWEAEEHFISEAEIIRTYWPWWEGELRRLGREHLISRENCIDDFIVANWATEFKGRRKAWMHIRRLWRWLMKRTIW